jgi:hypothetical protein
MLLWKKMKRMFTNEIARAAPMAINVLRRQSRRHSEEWVPWRCA